MVPLLQLSILPGESETKASLGWPLSNRPLTTYLHLPHVIIVWCLFILSRFTVSIV